MTQVILTSGTSWGVPQDFDKNSNKIEAIGGGAGSGLGSVFGGGGVGKAGIIVITYTPIYPISVASNGLRFI